LYHKMTNNPEIKIAYFGSYNPLYTRVRTTLKGLRKNNIEVIECLSSSSFRLWRLISLFFKYLKIAGGVDVLMVSEAGQTYVPLAKILSVITNKPLLFDAFLSYYHVRVEDEKAVLKNSLKGKYFYYLDKLSCQMADLVILDTQEHIEYFCKTFNLLKGKFRWLPVGSDDELFYPRINGKVQKKKYFLVFLVSSFYPLHGVEYVVEAAKLLEKNKDIKFLIVGDGPTKKNIEKLVKTLNIKNIKLKESVLPPQLAELMSIADICLGQFGATSQSQMVIPAKVYDAIAMAKPVITGESNSIKKVFTDKENIILCPMANPKALAESIIALKENLRLRQKISANDYRLFCDNFSLSKIGEKLKNIIEELIKSKQ